MHIRAFRGYRPVKDRIDKVASRPYDVLTTAEARQEAADNPFSFMNIVKPEITFPAGADPGSPDIYRATAVKFQSLIDNGTFVRDRQECLYIYKLFRRGYHGVRLNGRGRMRLFAQIILSHSLKSFRFTTRVEHD